MLAFAGTLCNHDLPPHLFASRVCPLSMLYLPYGAGAWIGGQKVVGLAITTIKAGSIITVAFLSCDRSAKLGGRSIAVGSGHCSLLHYVRKRYLASNCAKGCSCSHHVRLNPSPRTLILRDDVDPRPTLVAPAADSENPLSCGQRVRISRIGSSPARAMCCEPGSPVRCRVSWINRQWYDRIVNRSIFVDDSLLTPLVLASQRELSQDQSAKRFACTANSFPHSHTNIHQPQRKFHNRGLREPCRDQ